MDILSRVMIGEVELEYFRYHPGIRLESWMKIIRELPLQQVYGQEWNLVSPKDTFAINMVKM
jgi:hypothetical protein